MHARVAFKRRKDVHERVMWIISIYNTPHEIMGHDHRTMRRLQSELYTNKAKKKDVIIREILDVKYISKSHLTYEEHQRQNKK